MAEEFGCGVDRTVAARGDGEEDAVRGYVPEEELADFCCAGGAGQGDTAAGGEAERVRDGGDAAAPGAIGDGSDETDRKEEQQEEQREIVLELIHCWIIFYFNKQKARGRASS